MDVLRAVQPRAVYRDVPLLAPAQTGFAGKKIALLTSKRDGGWAALKIMEDHLSKHDFFVNEYSIADIALFAYTHVSHEGGFPLNDFPEIRRWIGRVEAQPGFVPML